MNSIKGMKQYTDKELEIKSIHYRKNLLKYIKKAKSGHTGGDLSSIDILNVLYNDVLNVSPENFTDPVHDRFIQSKGHSVEALYVVLADVGFFPEEDLNSLCTYMSPYVGHPTRKVRGIEFNTGALGHGLPISSGIALSAKIDSLAFKTYTLLGDGELAEGSNWEAAMMAAHYGLDNLIAIIDHNTLQISGRNKDVCSPYPIDEKFRSFGWEVTAVNGHSFNALREVFGKLPLQTGKPSLIIANTVKGKGVSYMEDETRWHHGVPSDEQFQQAMRELDVQLDLLTSV
jgi:transketolase